MKHHHRAHFAALILFRKSNRERIMISTLNKINCDSQCFQNCAALRPVIICIFASPTLTQSSGFLSRSEDGSERSLFSHQHPTRLRCARERTFNLEAIPADRSSSREGREVGGHKKESFFNDGVATKRLLRHPDDL